MSYSKYRAKKVTIDGITFDSQMEGRRYLQLKTLQIRGEITHLELQPEYKIVIDTKLICKYKADFRYIDQRRQCTVVEDVKSKYTAKNPVYRLKKKLVEAMYPGTKIEEVQA